MATITVSTNITNSTADTAALTLASGDTVNLLPNVGIFNYGTGASDGIHAGGSNSFILNGDVFSMNRAAIAVFAGNNDINIGAASTVLGHGRDLHHRQQQRDRRRRPGRRRDR